MREAYYKKYYRVRLAEGLCVDCGRPKDRPDKIICSACKKKRRARVDKLIAQGICTNCYKPNDRVDRVICSACAQKRKEGLKQK